MTQAERLRAVAEEVSGWDRTKKVLLAQALLPQELAKPPSEQDLKILAGLLDRHGASAHLREMVREQWPGLPRIWPRVPRRLRTPEPKETQGIVSSIVTLLVIVGGIVGAINRDRSRPIYGTGGNFGTEDTSLRRSIRDVENSMRQLDRLRERGRALSIEEDARLAELDAASRQGQGLTPAEVRERSSLHGRWLLYGGSLVPPTPTTQPVSPRHQELRRKLASGNSLTVEERLELSRLESRARR